MIIISKAVVSIVLLALAFGTDAESNVDKKRYSTIVADSSQAIAWLCSYNPFAIDIPICRTTTTRPPTTASTEEFDFLDETTASPSMFTLDTTVDNTGVSTTPSPATLERARWCLHNNGTYLPPGYTFMHTACILCQCTQIRTIRCATLQCMPTHCIDNSKPAPRPSQCCSQCSYEPQPMSCVHNGFTFPHGTIIKTKGDSLQCWCQLGSVECRKSLASVFSGLDLWGSGTAIYVVVVIVFVLLLMGTLICCGCTAIYYFYYKHNQQSVQDSYEQYWNTAGWQPMNEEGHVVDANVEEKQEEAEQSQYQYEYPTGQSEAYVPPPYAIYNGSFATENSAKQQ